MRLTMILIVTLTASSAALGQETIPLAPNFRIGPAPAEPCRGADLSVRHVSDDAAMGGQNLSDYAFRNNAASACTLKGYPSFELLNKAGKLMPRGRAINSRQLPGDEAAGAPELITLESGKEAVFRVYYNSGGAGHTGKPCPKSRKVKIAAPGTTRSFILDDEIQSCGKVQVSAIRKSMGVD